MFLSKLSKLSHDFDQMYSMTSIFYRVWGKYSQIKILAVYANLNKKQLFSPGLTKKDENITHFSSEFHGYMVGQAVARCTIRK